MDLSVCGQHPVLVNGEFFARVIGHFSAGLFHDQVASCAVPGLEFMFIKAVESSGSHPAQIDGGGTQSSYRDALAYKTFKDLERPVRHVDVGVGKTGDEAGVNGPVLFADSYGLIIQERARSFFGKEKFIHVRVINGTHNDFSLVFNGNGYAIERNTVGKVDRTVDRVNDPFILGILDDLAGFFTQDMMTGKMTMDRTDDGLFGSMISFGDQVIHAFLVADPEGGVEETYYFSGAGAGRFQ